MDYTPITPFRRAMTYAHLQQQKVLEPPLPPQGVNKFETLRELAHARLAFGLTDRDLAVLQALVSFYHGATLSGDLLVYPSNRALCERLNGMPCSTMRRHLAALVQAGVILRRDSPNGKRYVRRFRHQVIEDETQTQAFGFDLTPLVARFEEFCAAAEARRAQEEAFDRLRSNVSLMRRDLAALVAFGRDLRPDLGLWDQLADLTALNSRALKRRLDLADLQDIADTFACGLNAARSVLDPTPSQKMSSNEPQNEQHYQNSNTDSYESELCLETAKAARSCEDSGGALVGSDEIDTPPAPTIPLALVLSVCAEIHAYAESPIRHWHDFVRAADKVRPMMGISPSAWDEARLVMGPEQAAIVLAAMLERFDEIRSPGGYLRTLVAKAEQNQFSSGPMIMALMRKAA